MKKILTFTLILVMLLCSVAFAGNFERTLLSAVSATGASGAVNTGDMETKTVYIVATGVSTGATVEIQTSYDGTNWVTINTQTVIASGVTEVAIVGLLQKRLRVNVTAWTDGVYTVYFFGKN